MLRLIVNDGNTGGTDLWQTSKIIQQDYPNPYGKRCFLRGRWNIDGGAWTTFETHQLYNFNIHFHGTAFTGDQDGSNLLAAVSIGISNDVVRIRTANGHHGNIDFNTDTGVQFYAPISHVFNIEYELFEVL